MLPARADEIEPDRELPREERPSFAAVGGAAAERIVWAGLAAVVAVVIASGLWSLKGPPASAHLPILGVVPDFDLVERSGRQVTRADLEGRAWVANFVFTNCAGVCPGLTASMARLRHELRGVAPEVRSVSVSVDPHRDTPAVLSDYADRYKADGEWLFLTGERASVHRLVAEGFQLSVAERSPEDAKGSTDLITHSDRFVLVDRQARIRGYYRGTEPDLIPGLLADVERLAAEG